ncbi:MAG: hypothetical protein DRQ58_10930 [Gammaproteobacteria bacterium]|nr:MAG: hypothetical protein DRQ58_10930 [Gammaproteobacteria bacterium]
MPEKLEEKSNIELSRRGFLTSIAGVAISLASPGTIASAVPSPVSRHDRELSFYNTHTGEKLSATFWSDGKYLDDGIEEISWILRDHRANIASPIDQKLLDLLHQLQVKVEHQAEFHVISGYRSPATNKMLNKRSSGVAKRSYHMLGKAIDVRLPGFDTSKLHYAAISLKGGGVGYYSSSNFIHMDVGRVRYW